MKLTVGEAESEWLLGTQVLVLAGGIRVVKLRGSGQGEADLDLLSG